MNADRRGFLVALLVTLVITRFVLVPWNEAQSRARENLVVLTTRLDRSVGVILNREAINSSLAFFESSNAVQRSKFPEAAGFENFRLEAQRRVTSLVEAQSSKVEAFDWVFEGPPDDTGVGFIRGRVTFRGDVRSQALLLGLLEGEMQNMVIREARCNFEAPARGPTGNRITSTLVADFYFLKKVTK